MGTEQEQEQEQSQVDDAEESLQEWKEKREQRRRQPQRKKEPDDLLLLASKVEDDDSAETNKDKEDEDADVAIPLAKRRRMEQEQLLLESLDGNHNNTNTTTLAQQRRKQKVLGYLGHAPVVEDTTAKSSSKKHQVKFQDGKETNENNNDNEGNEENGSNNDDKNNEGEDDNVQSMLERAEALQDTRTEEERTTAKRKEEEERILRESSKVQTNALQAASELAHGVSYKEPMPSSWTVPRYILEQGEAAWQKIRKEWHMEVEGETVPPPMKRFVDMKLPPPVLKVLNKKGIKKPTPIQMQGLPVALAGRDMVGIAFTGSGKTLTFCLPMVMAALEEELSMPLKPGEGPVSIVMAPSRELARQTYEQVEEFCTAIGETQGYPKLRAQLFIGGESVRDQLQTVRNEGVHCIVATPGRLRDVLKRKAMTLDICRFIALDEADRMLDLGFDEEVGEIMNYFRHQRQTLLFSATFPQKFRDFARQTLVQPIVVNVGRAGAANLDVIQEVEYVKQEAKIVYLLHCLQKTSPPVIIFCERKGDVDDIHEYLLLKGVDAVSIHGGKDQEERNEAIALYKAGKKDVLGTLLLLLLLLLLLSYYYLQLVFFGRITALTLYFFCSIL